MGAQRTSFDKLQRDRNKKAKQAAKREARQDKSEGVVVLDGAPQDVDLTDSAPGEPLSAAELLVRVEQIHKRFDAGTLSYDDFEEQKADLLSRLPID